MAKPKKVKVVAEAPVDAQPVVVEPVPAPTFKCVSCEKPYPLAEAKTFRYHLQCGRCFAVHG